MNYELISVLVLLAVFDVAGRVQSMGWDMLMNEHRLIKRETDAIAIIGVENTTPSHHFHSRGNLAEASDSLCTTGTVPLEHDCHFSFARISVGVKFVLSTAVSECPKFFRLSPRMYTVSSTIRNLSCS